MVSEAKGNIWYGMHFYPGLAQYEEDGKPPYRVYLSEDTIRGMDPSFAGCPVFVLHVEEVQPDLNELRKEADGWVIESFFNQADGKHWVKFICCSDKAEKAIAQGMRLSNCYIPKTFGPGGTWNGIEYNREILTGEYEHLAIVPNPRYEESVIMDPDEFKKYNEDKMVELKRLANNKKEGEGKMGFSFFKRAKVDNSTDMESMSVELPKSKKEVKLAKLINDADEHEMKKDEPKMAHPDHHIEVNGEKMPVKALMQRYKDACNTIESMKKMDAEDESEGEKLKDGTIVGNPVNPSESGGSSSESANDDEDQDMEVAKKKVPKPDDDMVAEKRALQLEREEEKEVKDAKRKNAADKAERLRNADKRIDLYEEVRVSLSEDKVARGKSLYGSN